MTDLSIVHYGAGALVITGWLGIIALVALKGWNGWLSLKRVELELAASHQAALGSGGISAGSTIGAATRIDVADLKERIRKLEAIAAGIDL